MITKKRNAMDISQVATLLRPVSSEVFKGKGKLCLSANYLNKLNCAFDTNIGEDINSSFHMVQTSKLKANLLRDLQFLLELAEKTISLKIIPDVNDDTTVINIQRFKNLRVLEIHKLDVELVVGIQKLRSQLQDLSCTHSINNLRDILIKCGGDNSQRFSWNELKTANFSYNNIVELDDSLECAFSLHTLDLSHNQINKVDFLSHLPNLKHLNLSYNKLDAVPRFKSQICTRLQVLVLNNNFIEELVGLTSLLNVVQLDLSQNCLLDHKTLLSISHLPTLQLLNLQGNPFSFHPIHRSLTCNYLNKNCSSLKFVLDNIPLSKSEKSLTGSLYPILQSSLLSISSNNSLDDSINDSIQERTKRVRNVTIEDDEVVKQEDISVATQPTSSQHLEIKRQVEQLREEYGESWLYRHSGLLVQDVLGFSKSSVLSSTPYESALDSLYSQDQTQENSTHKSTQFETAKDNSNINQSDSNEVYVDTVETQDDLSDASDGEDIFSGGEECIFLATNRADNNQVFVVVTETHISERDVTTSKEKARWHINTVISCEKLEDNQNIIKIEFDTVRRDRKQRIYELDPTESVNFSSSIHENISKIQKSPEKKVMYQCMKCAELFPKESKNPRLDEPTITCPKCESNLVVESV